MSEIATRIAMIENFMENAASVTEPLNDPSTCASESQTLKGNEGSLMSSIAKNNVDQQDRTETTGFQKTQGMQ